MRRHPEDEYGCIGCWRFDQGSGLYEPDVSGNSVNLTDNDGDIPTSELVCHA